MPRLPDFSRPNGPPSQRSLAVEAEVLRRLKAGERNSAITYYQSQMRLDHNTAERVIDWFEPQARAELERAARLNDLGWDVPRLLRAGRLDDATALYQEIAGGSRAEATARVAAVDWRHSGPPAVTDPAENLRLWSATGFARAWVDAHDGEWDHPAWLELLDELQRTPYWPMNPNEIGAVVELTKRQYHQQRKGRPKREPSPPQPPIDWESTLRESDDRKFRDFDALSDRLIEPNRDMCSRCRTGVFVPTDAERLWRSICDSCLLGNSDEGLFGKHDSSRCRFCGSKLESVTRGNRGGPFDNVWITQRCPRCG